MPKLVMMSAGKAGTGRSTTCRALLVSAVRAQFRVVAIDTDRQQTVKKWAGKRAATIEQLPGSFVPVEVVWSALSDVEREIERHADADLILLDTPPTIEDAMAVNRNLIARADLVIVPTSDTADDLDSVVPWIRELVRDGARVNVLLNRVNRNFKTFLPAQTRLLKLAPVVPVIVSQHVDIPTMHAKGLTVLDIGKMKGADAYDGLWAHVRREIGL